MKVKSLCLFLIISVCLFRRAINLGIVYGELNGNFLSSNDELINQAIFKERMAKSWFFDHYDMLIFHKNKIGRKIYLVLFEEFPQRFQKKTKNLIL